MTTISVIFIILLIIVGIPAGIVFGIIALVRADEKRTNVNSLFIGPVQMKYTPPKERKKLSASSVMLLIGTVFIVLSAITFVAANWVKMDPSGRVFTLAGASVLAFGICAVLKTAAGLEKTSSAFYIIGSLVAVTAAGTAGKYEMFGSWLSTGGEGSALFHAILMFISAIAAFSAVPVFKSPAFNYLGLSFFSAVVIFICVQFTSSFEEFAVAVILVQLVLTALIHIIGVHKGISLEKPVKIISDCSSVIFASISMIYVLSTTFDATWYTFAILAVIIAQLFLYGIFKKQTWMLIFANVLSIYTDILGAEIISKHSDDNYAVLFFAFVTAGIYVINMVIPQNIAIARVIAFAGMVFGACSSLTITNNEWYGLNLIVPAISVIALMIYTFSKNEAVQIISGLALPVIPYMMTSFFENRIKAASADDYSLESIILVRCILILAYIAIAAFYVYLPKLSFNFYAHHQIKTHTAPYALMVSASVMLIAVSGYSQLFAAAAALCILHAFISNKLNCNIVAAGSVVGIVTLVYNVLNHYIPENDDAVMFTMFGLFLALMIASKLIFPEKIACRKENRVIIDFLLFSAWTAIVPMPFVNKTSTFIRLISVAIVFACIIKKNTNDTTASVLLSLSAFFTTIAFMTRPFLNPDSSMISSKITLAIMAVSGIAYKYIWRNHKNASKLVSTIIFVLSFIGLIIDGLVYDNVMNRIFVLAVTAGILILSFYTKSKTWFITSSVALVVMTIASTYRYFDAAGWWIYLLAVGIIFIVIAAVNEACRKKGETMKETVSKTFSDWTW